ncbi:hypothetical protein BT96DRAFT_956416 [Gymnopus androsaceus JB14]|uniref:DEAD/DEAH-box helicase domain-containing protein n=1 Tax=Gymnopus androsaceus JB14 TaxID=1447944 RepID=A0A6A4HXI4_9AGAR|nr:hypothetical protein BT96DRAFT_956416 [Gymnopus androsaceus JB14]
MATCMTGDGKSALFIVPILAHLEISTHPAMYPAFLVKSQPVVMVITPTKGLPTSLVHTIAEAEAFGISGFSYCHEHISEYCIDQINLEALICKCRSWSLICVDPEHLASPEWCHIIYHEMFCSNLTEFVVDKSHLIGSWGSSGFRPQFEHIGAFIKGCLPAAIPVVVTTATCASGTETSRKTIIHVSTIPEAYVIFEYLWDHIPQQYLCLCCIWMYHSVCLDAYNKEMFDCIDLDPYLQVVIGTPAIRQGINRCKVLDSIFYHFPSSLNGFVQGESIDMTTAKSKKKTKKKKD